MYVRTHATTLRSPYDTAVGRVGSELVEGFKEVEDNEDIINDGKYDQRSVKEIDQAPERGKVYTIMGCFSVKFEANRF